MKTTKESPWNCAFCNYKMDAVTGFPGDAVPNEGDLTICLKCGGLYTRHLLNWEPITDKNLSELSDDVLKELTGLEAARQIVSYNVTNDTTIDN